MDLTPDQATMLAVVGALGTAFATVVLAVYTIRLQREARRQRLQLATPRLVLRLYAPSGVEWVPEVVNVGPGAAIEPTIEVRFLGKDGGLISSASWSEPALLSGDTREPVTPQTEDLAIVQMRCTSTDALGHRHVHDAVLDLEATRAEMAAAGIAWREEPLSKLARRFEAVERYLEKELRQRFFEASEDAYPGVPDDVWASTRWWRFKRAARRLWAIFLEAVGDLRRLGRN